jgi:hypothetical protein
MHLRSVAGVFVLSTGLLIGIGGGAIASADSDASSGTPAAEGANQATTTSGSPTATPVAQPSTVQDPAPGDVTATAATTGGGAGQATTDATGTPTVSESELEKNWIEAASSDAETGSTTTAPATSSAPAPPVVAADSNVPASTSNAPPAETSVAASSSNVVSPVTTYVSPLVNAVQTAGTNALNAVANAVTPAPTQAAAVPAATPVAAVISSVQQMLDTVAGVVAPFVQLPADIYALLGVPQATVPSLIGESGAAAFPVDEAAPLFGPGSSHAPVVAAPVSWDGSLFGTMMTPPSVAVVAPSAAALAQQLSLSGMAQLAPEGIRPASARSLLEHVVTAVLVPASLTALAALALPGIAGLLVVCAAGMRVGYRQAKAALTMRASGIARFAGTGPMGVVRSGALISLHARPHRVKRVGKQVEATPVAVRHLERVA